MFRIFIKISICVSIILLSYGRVLSQWTKVTPASGFDNYTKYCVKEQYILISNGYNILYRSSDNGDSWTTINDILPNSKQIYAMTSSNEYLVLSSFTPMLGEQPGIYRSTNLGDTWKIVEGNGSSVDGVFSFCRAGKYLLASGPANGIIRSIDDGNSWEDVSKSIQEGFYGLTSDGNYLYAITSSSKLYRSLDSGATWEMPKNQNLSNLIFAVAADSSSHSPVFASSGSLYRSNDNGENWIELSGSWPISATKQIAFHNDYIFAGGIGTDRPVYYSKDQGNTWVDFGGQLGNDKAYLLFVKDNYLFLGTYEGLWRRPLSDLRVTTKKESSLQIEFSNPTNEKLVVKPTQDRKLKSLSIVDILGKTVYSSNTFTDEPISISHLSSGYYQVISYDSENELISGSFLK